MGTKRVLVTGASGYLGGAVAKGLGALGHDVLIVGGLAGTLGQWAEDFTRLELDWMSDGSLEKAVHGCSSVIHAAGVNARDSLLDPAAALQFNGVATTRLLAAAMRKGVRQFVYLSTAHVYAEGMSGHLTEDSLTKNAHPYATSHLAGENSTRFYGGVGGMETISLRLSNVYGPPVQEPSRCWTLFVNDISRQAVQEGLIRLHGQPNLRRNFVSFDYLLEVLNWFLNNHQRRAGAEIYNVGSIKSLSLIEMAKMVQKEAREVIGREPVILTSIAHEPCDDLNLDVRKLVTKTKLFQDSHSDQLRSLLRYCMGVESR